MYLCDQVLHPKIMEHVQTIKEQLKRHINTIPVVDVVLHTTLLLQSANGFMVSKGVDGAGVVGLFKKI